MKVIALFVLIISLIHSCTPKFSLASDEGNGLTQRTKVFIYNDIGQGENLSVHCKSKDDDLGTHAVQYNQSYQWEFKVDLFDRTRFSCELTARHGSGTYDIYVATRDYHGRCPDTCNWKIRKNGVNGLDKSGKEDLYFAWQDIRL
ncbi:Plant self-incompatibility protein S1 family [Euphorbia peplus]|nr:Plant self-incompatibility protein S1 family [Euphorbia peplus]